MSELTCASCAKKFYRKVKAPTRKQLCWQCFKNYLGTLFNGG